MQKGFLSGGAKPRGGGSGNASAAAPAEEEEAKPMPSHSTPPPPPPAATPPDPSSSSRSLKDCLDLLRGPTDERRLVGLLLATRVLPKGDDASLSAAREAIGDAFLERLLLPLDNFGDPITHRRFDSYQQQPPSPSSSVDPELTLREAGQISLSLAVSSAFAGGLGIQVAGSEEFLALAPRWCKVVAARGAVAALGGLPQIAAASFNPESEESATRDALDCLLAAALSGRRGREAAAAAGGAAAAARALAGVDCYSPSKRNLPRWLERAARLLAFLLPVEGGGGKAEPAPLLLVGASDLAAAVPALAALLSPSPEALLAGAAADAAAAAVAAAGGGKPSESDAASNQLDALAAFDALASHLDDDGGGDGEDASSATATRAALARSAAAASPPWPCAARVGLAGLLRARAGPSVRHAALRVSAFFASLVSEGSGGRASWLLLRPRPPAAATMTATTTAKSKNDGDASAAEFLRVLSEVSRVESALLFRDAEDGDTLVAVPEAARFGGGGGNGGGNCAAAAAAAASSASASPAAREEEEGDDDSSLKPPPRLNVTDGDLDAAAGRWHEKRKTKGGGEGPSSSSSAPPGEMTKKKAERRNLEPAACRAERTLPSVLALVEAALDALANDAEAGERRAREKKRGGRGGGRGGGTGGGVDAEVEDILGGRESAAAADDDDDGGDGDDEDFSGALFSDEVAVRAFASLKDAVEQGLDYLEGRAPGLVQSQASSLGPSPPSAAAAASPSERAARLLAPAAARCLGRLLADAPAAFGARPRTLLPCLLPLRCGGGESGGGGTCGRFFLPVLSGALAAEQQGDSDDDEGESRGGETEEGRVASLSLDDGDAGAWLAASRNPAALSGLAATLAAACSDAAARRSGGGGGGGGEEGENSGDGEVAAAAAVLTGLLPRPSPSYLPLRRALVPALASWAASRLGKTENRERKKKKEKNKMRKKSDGGAAAAAALLSTANEAARALALLLASSGCPSSPSSSSPSSRDLPPSAAAASSAALVACLRPGWEAWTLRSKKKTRKEKEREKKKGRRENGESFEDRALLLSLEGRGGGDELKEVEHENDFGLSAAPLEDASHLAADDSALSDELEKERGKEGHEDEDEHEGLRFDEEGGHDERGWRRALRAAALVVESDSSSSSSSSAAAGALLSAASSAPWLRELLEEEEEEEEEKEDWMAAAIQETKTAEALRAFIGALRRRLRLMRVEGGQ